MYRTHNCSELRLSNKSETVTLSGWVNRRRDHGGLIFIDLRDRYGITQIVFDPAVNKESWEVAEKVRSEYVLKVTGEVKKRMEGQHNEKMETGEIELYVHEIEVLNSSETPPFEIDQEKPVNEELRLQYRYLDLRHDRLKNNIVLRHQIIKAIRDFLDENSFLEIETPMLIKGTPEGSREYLVPSRIYPGQFFVLPQSPQQLKQLLMISGFDRYFQVARCFRDEDQRGDRQPEFTQLDMELSFTTEKEVMKITEKLLIQLTEKFAPQKKIQNTPFPIMSWKEAMENYGSDKPDIRFDMKITDVSEAVKDCDFKVFSSIVQKGGVVKTLRVEGAAGWARSELDKLEELAKIHGAKGLAYFVYKEEGPAKGQASIKSPIAKFLSEETIQKITEITGAKTGDIVFFGADSFESACNVLGQIRLECAKKLNLVDADTFAYCWVNEFPMYEKDEAGQLAAMHHPFTRPMDEDLSLMEKEPENARAIAYDIVLNGNEIGGGSLRIHESDLQKKVFTTLGIDETEAEKRFGHMLEAFKYGAPPHGGIAWGLDRLLMIFADELNIREVMAFPKDQKAKDLMLGAPSETTKDRLDELEIKIIADR